MLKIYPYNAGKGECIRLQFGSGTMHNIFFDTGVSRFGVRLKAICKDIVANGERLDLLILTHVDDDHIGGILHLLRTGWKSPFEEVRMNRYGTALLGNRTLSVRQNNEVFARLEAQDVKINSMLAGDRIDIDGATIETLHPTSMQDYANRRGNALLAYRRDYAKSLAELADAPIRLTDTSDNNKNSIVCTFSYDRQCFLFTGDAWAEDIVSCLPEVKCFDLIKLPHHGSVGNISEGFPSRIIASSYMVCTDGISHPDKQTIAKLVKWYGNITIYSPSSWWTTGFFTKDDDKSKMQLVCGEMIPWLK